MSSTVKVISREELERMHTGSLMKRRAALFACEESFEQSDRVGYEPEPFAGTTGPIEFKNSSVWKQAYNDVTEVLSTREHLPNSIERKAQRKIDKRGKHKDPRLCPVCTSKLSKVSKGTRKQNQCANCKAVFAKELHCLHCNSNRVWRGPKGIVCHGCGHAQA